MGGSGVGAYHISIDLGIYVLRVFRILRDSRIARTKLEFVLRLGMPPRGLYGNNVVYTEVNRYVKEFKQDTKIMKKEKYHNIVSVLKGDRLLLIVPMTPESAPLGPHLSLSV